MDVLDEIRSERDRQRDDEGWSPQHDDAHRNGEMAGAAACYAMHGISIQNDRLRPHVSDMVRDLWPWASSWWKPKNVRRDLIRAAALIVAEIERRDRVTVQRMADKLEASGTQIDPDLYGRVR